MPELCREQGMSSALYDCSGSKGGRMDAPMMIRMAELRRLEEDVRRRAAEGRKHHLACHMFEIRQFCYRYQAKLSSENSEIAGCVLTLTNSQHNWIRVYVSFACEISSAFR